jgi:hypothetical protein
MKPLPNNACGIGHANISTSILPASAMAAQSPPPDSRDPFQLERLAEELASRELNPLSSQSSPPLHDLPIHEPLSHSNPYITAPTFNVEDFLLSRSHTSLPDLRSELRDYLGSLKEELVKLINDDYEAFISLSTDLRGEGTRLERLNYPLETLRSKILVCLSNAPLSIARVVYTMVQTSKSELQLIQDAIQEKLEKRAILREEQVCIVYRIPFMVLTTIVRPFYISCSKYQSQ